MTNAQVCGTNNVEYLSALLYRPLYWFGNSNTPSVNFDYSIGQAPVFSNNNQTVTVTMNSWKWSNGEQVTSRNVEEWVNIYKANPSANYCGYVPPGPTGEKFFPDNVVSMDTPSANTIVFHLTQSYNPTWFLYNELSQITPLPLAWDRTALSQPAPTSATASLPDSTTTGAEAVYKFLDAQSKLVNSWSSSPIWSVVDGPFKLSAFTATGEVDMVPNPTYSGSPKPTIAKFVELPYTDDNAETTALKTRGPSGQTVAPLPPQDAGQLQGLLNQGYGSQAAYTFSYNFFPLNLNNPTLGPTFQQLYFRQAFQHLVNQKGWITAFQQGWAYATAGPVPIEPANSFASALSKAGGLTYSVSEAKTLLTSHGWKINPGGVSTCQNAGSGPGQCGAGVKPGTALEFIVDYATGSTTTQEEMQNLAQTASQVGVKLDLTQHDFNTVISTAINCKSTQPTCKWTSENWGAGWIYAPDFAPTGESLFQTSAVANYGNYDDPTANQLIQKTTTAAAADTQAALNAYQDYIISQTPVIWQPTAVGNPAPNGPMLISNKLGGVTPNVYSYITPETWYFSS
jgi:peptide/nickel transport system substrate-binding protein